MKKNYIFALGLFTLIASAHAQMNPDRVSDPIRRDIRSERDNDEYISEKTLEKTAFFSVEKAIRSLRTDLELPYPNDPNNPRGRESVTDILRTLDFMESDVRLLREYSRGRERRETIPAIQASLTSLDNNTYQLLTTVGFSRRGNINRNNQVFEVVKSVGALRLALTVEKASVILPAPAPVPAPYPDPVVTLNIKSSYCSLAFKNSWDSNFLVTSEGFDVSQASQNLYKSCSTLGGTANSVSNAQLCQSYIGASKCFDAYSVARVQDPRMTRFTACTVNFANSWGSNFTTNGSGPNMITALAQLWDSCSSIGGTANNISNANLCRKAIVDQTFSCVVR